MENFVCRVCQEKAFSLCTCSSYLCKNHEEEHKCFDSLDKIIISLYKNVDDESRKILTLFLEEIKSKIAKCLSLPMENTEYYDELHRQSMQIGEQLLFVQNSRYIKNDLFLSPIEFFLTRTQSETNVFIEEISIINIYQTDVINFGQIQRITNNIYNFNYFKLQFIIANWISVTNDDLFTFFYQKGIELLWYKSYKNAKTSFLLCKSISEKVISYEKICKEILNLALSVTEQLLIEKEMIEIIMLIEQNAKALQDAFPLSLNLILYEISRIYVSIENYNSAIEYCLECLKNIQKEIDKFYIWIYLGFLYQCKFDFENAKIYYDKCWIFMDYGQINSQPYLCNRNLSIGDYYIAKGEYQQGIDWYTFGYESVSHKNNPTKFLMWSKFHWKLGEGYDYLNDFEKSKKFYTKAKELMKPHYNMLLIDIYLKASQLYLKNFDFKEAKKKIKSCINLSINFRFNHIMVFAAIYRILGIIKFHQGSYEKCELFLQRSLKLCEKHSNISWFYFIIELNILEFYNINYNYKKAKMHIRRLNEKIEYLKSQNYNNFLYYDILSTFYIMSNDIDNATAIIDMWQQRRSAVLIYDSNEKREIYCLNALKSLFLKDFQASEGWLMEWKKLQLKLDKSQFFKFNRYFFFLYSFSNNISKVIDHFLEVVRYFENCLEQKNPKLGILYIYLGLFYIRNKEETKSIGYFEKALSIFAAKSQSKDILFSIYNNLGVLNMSSNPESAQNYFLKAKEIFDRNKVKNFKWIFEFHLNQALYWVLNGNATESRIWIKKSKKFTYKTILNSVEMGFLEALTWISESNYRKAKRILIKRLISLRKHNIEHIFIEKLYKAIAECCKSMNQIGKYEKYMKKYTQLLIERNAPACTDHILNINFYYLFN